MYIQLPLSKVNNSYKMQKVQNFSSSKGLQLHSLREDTVELTKNASSKEKINKFIKKLGKPIEEASNLELLKNAGIVKSYNKETGDIILHNYKQPDKDFTWSSLGVDENNFFKNVIVINGDADFKKSNASHLGKLQVIRGNADFLGSSVTDLGDLEVVEGSIDCRFSDIKDLKNLRYVGKNAYFVSSQIEDMGNLERVGGRTVMNGLKEFHDYNNVGLVNIIKNSVSRALQRIL